MDPKSTPPSQELAAPPAEPAVIDVDVELVGSLARNAHSHCGVQPLLTEWSLRLSHMLVLSLPTVSGTAADLSLGVVSDSKR